MGAMGSWSRSMRGSSSSGIACSGPLNILVLEQLFTCTASSIPPWGQGELSALLALRSSGSINTELYLNLYLHLNLHLDLDIELELNLDLTLLDLPKLNLT